MSADGLIPARYADIFWNADGNCEDRIGSADVVVFDRREPSATVRAGGARRYKCATGAHVAGWLTDDHPEAKPEGVFAANWLNPATPRDAVKAALREFGKIEECEWARIMLAALDRIDRYNAVDAGAD